MPLVRHEFARLLTRALGATLLALWLAAELTGRGPFLMPGGDFLAFYTGGRSWLQGDAASLYDFAAQQRWQQALSGSDAGMHPFVNPPWAVPLYVPFAALPYLPAALLWWTVQAGAAAAAVLALRRALLPEVSPADALVSYFTFPASVLVVAYGQATGLLLLASAMGLLALRTGRDGRAAAWLSLLWIKPQLVVGWAVIGLALRRWRLVGGLAVGGGVAVAVGLLLAPGAVDAWLASLPEVDAYFRSPRYPSWGLASAYGAAVLALQGTAPGAVHAVAALLAAALLGTAGLALWRRPGDDRVLAGALLASLAASAHLYWYDLALLALPMAVAWRRVDGRDLAWLAGAAFLGPLLTLNLWKLSGEVAAPDVTFLVLAAVALRWSLAAPALEAVAEQDVAAARS